MCSLRPSLKLFFGARLSKLCCGCPYLIVFLMDLALSFVPFDSGAKITGKTPYYATYTSSFIDRVTFVIQTNLLLL